MVTMVDEIFDRHYQAGRTELNGALVDMIKGLGRNIGLSLRVLNRIQFSAPWLEKPKSAR
jgi:hypothetical protein